MSGDEDEWIPGETAITCCPSGFGASNSDGRCRLELKEIWTNTPCVAGSAAAETATLTAQATSRPYAQMLRLRYQESDLTQPLPGGGSSGLSTGSKAAIGVVVPIVVISLVLGVLFFWRRRKQQKNKQDSKPVQIDENQDYQKAELDATGNHQPETGLITIGTELLPQTEHYPQPAVADRVELEDRQVFGSDVHNTHAFELTGQTSEYMLAELPTVRDNQSSAIIPETRSTSNPPSQPLTVAVPIKFSQNESSVKGFGMNEAEAHHPTSSDHNGDRENSDEQRLAQLQGSKPS